jgi:hypothetical protein
MMITRCSSTYNIICQSCSVAQNVAVHWPLDSRIRMGHLIGVVCDVLKQIPLILGGPPNLGGVPLWSVHCPLFLGALPAILRLQPFSLNTAVFLLPEDKGVWRLAHHTHTSLALKYEVFISGAPYLWSMPLPLSTYSWASSSMIGWHALREAKMRPLLWKRDFSFTILATITVNHFINQLDFKTPRRVEILDCCLGQTIDNHGHISNQTLATSTPLLPHGHCTPQLCTQHPTFQHPSLWVWSSSHRALRLHLHDNQMEKAKYLDSWHSQSPMVCAV